MNHNYASSGSGAASPSYHREYGTVKMWKQENGYGFIIPDVGGDDIFAHVSKTPGNKPLERGVRVSYAAKRDKKTGKLAAEDIIVETS